MRRLVLTSVVLAAALAAPAAALARPVEHSTDGTLVIRGADNGDGTGASARPVAILVVTGFVIGRVSDQGKIQIFDTDPTDQGAPEVTGAGSGTPVRWQNPTTGQWFAGTQWSGSDFRFRAVQGTFRVVIYGSGVYVFAAGNGIAKTTGNPADQTNDGQYSLNGGDFSSLTTQTLQIG